MSVYVVIPRPVFQQERGRWGEYQDSRDHAMAKGDNDRGHLSRLKLISQSEPSSVLGVPFLSTVEDHRERPENSVLQLVALRSSFRCTKARFFRQQVMLCVHFGMSRHLLPGEESMYENLSGKIESESEKEEKRGQELNVRVV
ncbi:uncharacterized protein EI90DRAFT_3014174 [Cantharellus anzutake]|uniref:uncharacterized protein n=1 Tax=Cantharellus anzutake TaxID=1750568 RepID=UPI0019088DB2|nr:uncharacterized protein EI90DRAFT_3014174 [Cantharellus anzutake]KAF8336415.1 hypothetical protein EI90DRAFT_3014174 [Cantharellus anzutake]